MDKLAPIGVFDSGIGGLSVWHEVRALLPHEPVIYMADSDHAPYGRHKPEEIIQYSEEISRFLLSQGAKIIVIACNTATGIAIEHLRRIFNVPFVGMEPAIKPAAEKSLTGQIGVLATAQTFEAEHFRRTKSRLAKDVEINIAIGDGLVELVEQGKAISEEARSLLHSYLDPMVSEGIDQLVLGCTHYPFLIPVIREIVPREITIHNPSPAVAKQVQRILIQSNGLHPEQDQAQYTFHSSGSREVLDNMVAKMLGE
ncbi:MAG: glutamate racemase [Bacteroidetes bacterium]|jgi:glutamate racemase|nr:glutamate racemase [Bacteroidota bacterium]MBT3751634.1 glutamate racemase [Bacteroidota bacterium]MBT4399467.1 glutamate racemase [Bacteroidota bacterium]MBT4409993.1 glutamate racemase [Bacteroidota bacterium]MBT5426274.1 glutamate racemase [Bacteroidota bacterium]